MPTKTESLLRLYRIDQQIRSLSSRLKGAQGYLTRIDRDLSALAARRDELRKKQKEFTALEAGLENEAETLESKIVGLREQMNSAQTSREYTAFQNELNTFKAQKESLENDALTKLGEMDTIKEELEKLEAEVAEREKVRDVAMRDVESRQAEVGDRLKELEAQRLEAARNVDQEAMVIYADFWENDDEPMSEIIEEDRRNHEYSCGECNMSLPMQSLSRVLSTGAITTCPSCQRILFVGGELRDRYSS
ncbi:MAG: zinc ribbon domain-containing protein [Planctomycetota bacterium]